jgi:hypothetical protein
MVEADYQTHHSADMDIRLNQDFSGPPGISTVSNPALPTDSAYRIDTT